jgi:hypothetical protein
MHASDYLVYFGVPGLVVFICAFYGAFGAFTHDGTELIAFFAVIATLLTLWLALLQYTKDNAWKRLQYTKDLAEKYFNEPKFASVLQMLDNPFYRLDIPNGQNNYIITDQILLDALYAVNSNVVPAALHPTTPQPVVTDERQYIVNNVDTMLEDLRFFEHAIESGLVEISNLKIFLKYWIRVILPGNTSDFRRGEPLRIAWLRYILASDFTPVLKLCRHIDPKNFSRLLEFANSVFLNKYITRANKSVWKNVIDMIIRLAYRFYLFLLRLKYN